MDEYWPVLEPYIEKALVKTKGDDYYDTPDVLEEIKQGYCQLWAVIHNHKVIGAVVSKIIQYPKIKVLHMWLIGGDTLETLEDTYSTLKEYALDNGCQRVMGSGRKGWTRLIKDTVNSEYTWTVDL